MTPVTPQVGKVLTCQGGHGHRQTRGGNALAALQNAAPQYGADQCIRPGGSYFHQQLAVIQQKQLPGAGCLYQLDRAGDAACTQLYRAALRQGDRAGQPPDTQFRPLQVDEQVRNADSVDHCQPVSVFGAPWERFMRRPVMPASTRRRRVPALAQAGPMVP